MPTLAAEFPNDNPQLHDGVIWGCVDPVGSPVAERVPPRAAAPSAHATEDDSTPAEAPAGSELALDVEHEHGGGVLESPPPPRASGIISLEPMDGFESLGSLDEEIVVEEMPPLGDDAIEVALADAAANDVASQPLGGSTELPPAPDDAFTVFVGTLEDVALSAGSPFVASAVRALLMDGRIEAGLSSAASAALGAARILEGEELSASFRSATDAWRAILRGTSEDFSACGGAMLDEWASDLLARLLGAPERASVLRRELRSRGVAAFGLIEAA